jgi:hypothetical protein
MCKDTREPIRWDQKQKNPAEAYRVLTNGAEI